MIELQNLEGKIDRPVVESLQVDGDFITLVPHEIYELFDLSDKAIEYSHVILFVCGIWF